jgi:class 3 adenylate cyclase
MLIPSYSRISAFALIAELFKFFYDPSQQRGELPLAREQRKLAAILAADVVGYARSMGRDASGT